MRPFNTFINTNMTLFVEKRTNKYALQIACIKYWIKLGHVAVNVHFERNVSPGTIVLTHFEKFMIFII